jgi:DNA-binding transcriptional LysR family regulator
MYSRLPQIIREVQARLPDAEVTFTEVYSGRQAEELREHRIDVGFALCVGPEPTLCAETVWTEPLIAVVPRRHPLAERADVALVEMAQETLLLFPRALGPHLYDRILAVCRKAGFEPKLGAEAAPQRTIVARVGAGTGISLVPASLQEVYDPEVVYLPLRPPTPILEFVVVWREHDHSPLLQRFLEVARDVRHTAPPGERPP